MCGSIAGPFLLSKDAVRLVSPRLAVDANRRVPLMEFFRRDCKHGADGLASV